MTFVAGKRCKPILLYVVLFIIGFSLVFFSVHRGRGEQPQNPPMHQH